MCFINPKQKVARAAEKHHQYRKFRNMVNGTINNLLRATLYLSHITEVLTMKRIVFFVALVAMLGGCATKPPTHTNNVCAVFDQKNGFFNNWEKDAKRAEARYGIPMPIIMATMNTESSYRHNARPPRTKLFGFIPWKRRSTAYGYSQALNGTWDHYVRATGNRGAKRTNFADAADFIGWYHRESVRRNGINPNNAYALYLNYYMGHSAYARTGGRASSAIMASAERTDRMARRYDQQLRRCGRR